MKRRLVLVSGAPGSGKTTLAVPLARALRFPLVSKDHLKETLARVLGGGADLQATRRLGAAAMETLWMLAENAPDVVLEANFRPKSEYERARIVTLDAKIVEVYCACDPRIAAQRFADRARAADHDRLAHPLTDLTPEMLAEYDGPVGLGAVVRADTQRAVDIAALAAQVSAAMIA